MQQSDRRRSWRSGRRRGVSIYIPGAVLERLGFKSDDAPPSYALAVDHEHKSGRVRSLVVNLFREDAS